MRTLDATNRLLALSLAPHAATDLATLGLVGTGMDSATRAAYLSTTSTYANNGIDLLTSRGPVRPLWSGGTAVVARLLTTNTYDQGKPDGQDYHLVTTSVTGAETTATPPVVLDPVTTTTGYLPLPSAATATNASGWVVRKPTSITLTAAGTSVASTVTYDSAGRAIEARKPGSSGSDALTSKAVFWTPGANTADSACGNRPEWAGQACVALAAGAIAGADAARMGTALPVKRVTGYSRFGTPTTVTESGTGPVSGTTQTWTRTTTTTLDAAERVTAVAITGTGILAGGTVDKVVTDYGNWPDWGAVLNVVAVVAEVVATVVPGPIGTAAGFISAGAYLATGNTEKAAEMAITATAQLVGAGLAAKAAVKAVQYASKIGRVAQSAVSKVARAAGASQCFTAGTQILMADGTGKNIEDIRVGDQVTSTDPDTGVTSTQAVAQLFQHDATDLLTITVGQDSVTVTAEHPFYVPDQGWTPARNLRAGDPLRTPNGTTITVSSVCSGPAAATVYNFEVTNTHTYYVHTGTNWALVHNTCAKGGVYALVTESGTVVRTGRTGNLARREAQPAAKFKKLEIRESISDRQQSSEKGA